MSRTFLLLFALFGLLSACTGLPVGVTPVNNFQLQRYLGTWYEIARLDHRFERGLSNVTATYSLRADGGINVINRGFDTADKQWQQAQGRAYFVADSERGHLKVSFFGPFFGTYAVFGLDQANYDYAFVSGNNTDYLWLLARQPSVDPALIERFRKQAQALGFPVAELIIVKHDRQ